jgi:hypothetical protein
VIPRALPDEAAFIEMEIGESGRLLASCNIEGGHVG